MAGRRRLSSVMVLLIVGGVALWWSGSRGLGLVCLAGIAGLLAATGMVRFVIGLLMVGIGLLGLLTVFVTSEPPVEDVQRWVAAFGVVALLASGLLVVAMGRRSIRGADRYEPDAVAPMSNESSALTDLDLWRAIDRGEDPTTQVNDEDAQER